MYRLLVQSVRDYAIYMLDENGVVLNWNAGAERAKGYKAEEIVGKTYDRFYSPEDRDAGVPRRNLMNALRDGHYAEEGWRYRKDGSAFWASIMIQTIRDEQGRFVAFAKITRDLTEKRDAEHKARHHATHDGLTGIFNRRGFAEWLEAEITRHPDSSFTLLHIDLDHFKLVNDGYGHAAGDTVLGTMVDRLKTIADEVGLLGRLGGDEFAILLRDAPKEVIDATAERILDTLRRPIPVCGNSLSIGCSLGVSTIPGDGKTAASLLRNADLALNRAKTDGRGRIRRYSLAMSEAALARSNLECRLRLALQRDEFRLLYQPIVDGRDGTLLGYEALIRWVDEAGESVAPATFVPLAETLGLMSAIGEWTLRTACRAASAWPQDLYVSVNLSATQFNDPPLANNIIRTLTETGLPAKQLMLEITETSVVQNRDAARTALDRLRQIGVCIALDDFGTGFSSLSLVQELPLTHIKIDRSFILDHEHTTAFIRSVTTLAEGCGLIAIAEGVETEEQRSLLVANGCIRMQGYLFGKPAPDPHTPSPALAITRLIQATIPDPEHDPGNRTR